MAMTTMESEWITEVEQRLKEFNEIVDDFNRLSKIWTARSYSTAITATDLTDTNRDYSTTDLANGVTLMNEIIDFRGNQPVTQGDYYTTLANILR